MLTVITNYFQSLFSSHSHMSDQEKSVIVGALNPTISESTSQNLIKDPTSLEIKEAMFAIHPDKAPGPNGFSASFFQTN